jgi:DNA-directed RNA polymerase specialized sigma24 family protein
MTNIHNQDENVQRYIEIDGEQIPVTEEVYRAYKRPLWAEHKRKERAKRCRNEYGFRCTNDCRTCNKLREGDVLSLDRFTEDGFEVADPVDIAELAADRLLLEQLVACLDDLEPDERTLIDALFYNDRTERDYAAEIGISHQAVGKRKQKVVDKLRALMGVSIDSK